jgi:hypothetical protein
MAGLMLAVVALMGGYVFGSNALCESCYSDDDNVELLQAKLSVGPLGTDNLQQLECQEKFEKIDPHIREMLDMPELMCKNKKLILAQESAKVYRLNRSNQAHHAFHPLMKNFDLASFFPRYENHVAADQREPVFITGPESSGTTFVFNVAVASLGTASVKTDRHDFVLSPNALFYHFSLPDGSYCEGEIREPVLQDFARGGESDGSTTEIPNRFFVNLSAVAQAYHIRNGKAKILQVARNPVFSLQSKMMHRHCMDLEISKAEQNLAFALMLEAMDRPEVVTLCYEQMIAEGNSYLNDKLAMIGIDAGSLAGIPAIQQGKTEAMLGETEAMLGKSFECDQDVKAYMTLCPQSPDTKLFRDLCD